jgi:hypothetical protein
MTAISAGSGFLNKYSGFIGRYQIDQDADGSIFIRHLCLLKLNQFHFLPPIERMANLVDNLANLFSQFQFLGPLKAAYKSCFSSEHDRH